MKRTVVLACLTALTAILPAFGQPTILPTEQPTDGRTPPIIDITTAPGVVVDSSGVESSRDAFATLVATEKQPLRGFYARGEFMYTWITGGRSNTPLLTTGNADIDPRAGILGAPTTRVLFGAQEINLSPFCAGKFTAGYWFGGAGRFGIEATGVIVGENNSNVLISSDRNGDPFLAVPFQNILGQNQRLILATPTLNRPEAGSFLADYKTEFSGYDVSGMLNIYRVPSVRVDLMAGYAYRHFEESLLMSYVMHPFELLPQQIGDFSLPGGVFGGSATDLFATKNEFQGGQIGARVGIHISRISFDATGKIAVGNNRQTVAVGGSSNFQASGD
ncbi:MAG: BBP7 family outer membrane beta-barrel protein, partial [Planctomycetes bacterium]|nr:BBP7 family outer membrane beta-barrel protein [Planctomycetota bacterium]